VEIFFAKTAGLDLARAWAAYLCFKVLLMIPLMSSGFKGMY